MVAFIIPLKHNYSRWWRDTLGSGLLFIPNFHSFYFSLIKLSYFVLNYIKLIVGYLNFKS